MTKEWRRPRSAEWHSGPGNGGRRAGVNGDFRSPAGPSARPGVRFAMAQAVMRFAVPRVPRNPQGRADRLRRRSADGRTDLLTSRYPLAFDDLGVGAGSGRGRDPCRGRPDGTASGRPRWLPE